MGAVQRRETPQWRPSAETGAAPAAQGHERHLVIAGTGRAGTSFLVRYLTELGLDTTLARNGNRAEWDAEANAGLETLLVPGINLPYVVKSPWISEYVEQILNEEQFRIDAFIVPVRDLVEAASSRVVLERRAIHQHNPWMAEELNGTWETYGHTPGGLVYSLNPLDQARLLAVQFHRLVLKASEAGVPLVFPVFPRIAADWKYLFMCLQPVLPPWITESAARAAHARIADTAKVRVTGEIARDASSNVIPAREIKRGAQFPSANEVDAIALRREIGRLRGELKEQLAAQELSAETADHLRCEISQLRDAKRDFEHAVQALRYKLERKSFRNRVRRALRRLGVERWVEA